MLRANLTKLIKFPRLVEINKAQKIIPKNNVNTNVNLKFNNYLNIFINLGLLILAVLVLT